MLILCKNVYNFSFFAIFRLFRFFVEGGFFRLWFFGFDNFIFDLD